MVGSALLIYYWYLSPSTVLFSLASEKLEDDDKSSIAARLLSLPKPDKIKLGYPEFPKLSEKTELRDLVTSDSWKLFDILKISPDWLALPPADWDSNPDYIEFRNFVRKVKVTNNCAERGVKLTTDYSKQVPHQGQPGEEQDLSGGGGGEEGQARRQEEQPQHMIYAMIFYDITIMIF